MLHFTSFSEKDTKKQQKGRSFFFFFFLQLSSVLISSKKNIFFSFVLSKKVTCFSVKIQKKKTILLLGTKKKMSNEQKLFPQSLSVFNLFFGLKLCKIFSWSLTSDGHFVLTSTPPGHLKKQKTFFCWLDSVWPFCFLFASTTNFFENDKMRFPGFASKVYV